MRLQRVIWAVIFCASISSVVNAAAAQNASPAGSPPSTAQQSAGAPGAAQGVQQQISNAEIIQMLQAGLSDKIIIPAIQKGPTNFDTSSDALVALKKAGASEALLTAVISAPRFSAQPAQATPTAITGATTTSLGALQQPQATTGIPGMTAQPSLPASAMVQQPAGSGSAYIPPSLLQPPTTPTTTNRKPTEAATTPLLSDCTNPGGDKVQQAEAAILLLVNNERQKQGSAKLKSSDPLAAVARQRSCRMAQTGSLDHVDAQYGDAAQQLNSAGFHVKSLAENLSESSEPDPAKSTVESWMSDPDHRGDMLDSSFACTGVGVAIQPDGTYIVTELFTPAPCAASVPN